MEDIPRHYKEVVLIDLLLLKKKIKYNPFYTNSGICNNVSDNIPQQKEILESLFRSWPEYSGNIRLPVHTSKKLDALTQFNNSIFKFNRLTKYGRARRRLLNHCIETLRNDLFTS